MASSASTAVGGKAAHKSPRAGIQAATKRESHNEAVHHRVDAAQLLLGCIRVALRGQLRSGADLLACLRARLLCVGNMGLLRLEHRERTSCGTSCGSQVTARWYLGRHSKENKNDPSRNS